MELLRDHLQPAEVESELDCEEERVEQVQPGPGLRHWDPVGRLVSLLALGVDPLNRPRFKQLIWCRLRLPTWAPMRAAVK